MMRLPVVVAAVALATAAASAQSQPGPATAKAVELRDKLTSQLSATAAALDGVMGYSIVDLTSGDRIERLPSEVFPLASTIKLTLLYELFKQADEGTINLEEMRPLDRTQVAGGDGVLLELTTPSLSLRDYATLMIVLSDNTATNVLIDAVGMQKVTARMAAAGLPGLKLRRKMIDLEAARRGDENVGSPADVAKLLAMIYRGEGLRKESAAALVATLKKSKNTALRRGVNDGIDVADKPGTLDGVESGAGIVYLPGRPYIFVAATTFLKDNAAGQAAITAASRAAFDYFSRIAKGSEYGREIR
ncbi:MAG: serine hydrolase [Vicinamibacterales bacterium]